MLWRFDRKSCLKETHLTMPLSGSYELPDYERLSQVTLVSQRGHHRRLARLLEYGFKRATRAFVTEWGK
jgi:hypothetical protein